MKNDVEIKVGRPDQDPPNMSRAGFWSWTDERITGKVAKQQLAPDVKPVVKIIAIDGMNPTR